MPVKAKDYDKADEELESGLWNVIMQRRQDAEDGKSASDRVLLTGQRLQLLILMVERTLKGIEWPDE